MFQVKNDPYYAPFDWAAEIYEYLDNKYKSKIFDEKLRRLFIKGLALAFIDEDKEFKEELEKLDFSWPHYYSVVDDAKGIKECYLEYIENQKDIYYEGR